MIKEEIEYSGYKAEYDLSAAISLDIGEEKNISRRDSLCFDCVKSCAPSGLMCSWFALGKMPKDVKYYRVLKGKKHKPVYKVVHCPSFIHDDSDRGKEMLEIIRKERKKTTWNEKHKNLINEILKLSIEHFKIIYSAYDPCWSAREFRLWYPRYALAESEILAWGNERILDLIKKTADKERGKKHEQSILDWQADKRTGVEIHA